MTRVKKLHVIATTVLLAVSVLVILLWLSWADTMSALRHDTERWAVVVDHAGSRMAIEPSSDEVWAQMIQVHQNQSTRFVGGIVERYGNKWGFRFRPDSVAVAKFTAEGLQATIRYVSENLDYWLGGWAYVSGKVVEVHSP